MWLISKYGFASVVQHQDKPGWVLVRTRDRSDLEEFCLVARDCDVPGFSEAAIEENPSADYRFRMTVKDEEWAELAKVLAVGIDYTNFKNEVASVDPERAAIYGTVWADLMKIQHPGSETWPDAEGQDRKDTVVRLYREAAAHLEWCLGEYENAFPAAEESEILGGVVHPPVIADSAEPDTVAILEQRMIQRIAVGFWERAGGLGFERLRNAIDQARAAAALQLTADDWVPMEDNEDSWGESSFTPPALIPNASLRPSQVPDLYVSGLDPIAFNSGTAGATDGSDARKWLELWTFALTFDGATYFGGDTGAGDRLADFTRSVEESFGQNGELPQLDLALARACLYSQQRRWLHSARNHSCPTETAKFLDALLRSIRSQL